MALAAAAAAADEVVRADLGDAAGDSLFDATEHAVSLSRLPDGSLGLLVGADDEGRALVKVGRGDVLEGDIVIGLDGTEVTTTQQYETEVSHIYATGVSDVVRLKLRRPPALVTTKQWRAEALTLGVGGVHTTSLIAEEPCLGEWAFACTGAGGHVTFAVDVDRGGDVDRDEADSTKLFDAHGAFDSSTPAEGTFRMPLAGQRVAVMLANATAGELTVFASLTLTPVAQAVAAEAARMRAALSCQAAHLEMLFKHEEGLRGQELELEQRLQTLRVSRAVATRLREEDEQTTAELLAVAHSALGVGSGAGADDDDDGGGGESEEQEHEAEANGMAAPAAHEGGAQRPPPAAPIESHAILSLDAEAAELAIASSKAKRGEAYKARRTVRGRAYAQEEHMMRAQVINFQP